MATTYYFDNMNNGAGAHTIVVNTGTPPNQAVVADPPHGLKWRNDQFDSMTNFGFHVDLGVESVEGDIWRLVWIPGELAFGQMRWFVRSDDGMSVTNTNMGPWGIVQEWDPTAGKSYLYAQHGSSTPVEETKIEIISGEPVVLDIIQQANGKLRAMASAWYFEDVDHDFGESNQDVFLGEELFASYHNVKSWNASDGSNHTPRVRIFNP
jgi:hypothetical protein